MSEIEKQSKNTELLNLFKPPKPLNVGFMDFIKELIYMTVIVIIFFWCGASFHTLMYGYQSYKSTNFKGVNIDDEPYTSSSVYNAKGMERFWTVFPEIIDWYQGTLKDVFSSGNYLLMRMIMLLRDNYTDEIPKKGLGFFGLMVSSVISGIAIFTSPVIAILLILGFGFLNIKHFFFTSKVGMPMGLWTGNGNESFFSPAFWLKLGKFFIFPNNILLLIGLCLMYATVPGYIFLAMLYWVIVFAAKGDKNYFNKDGKFNQIWQILKKHSMGIASFWLLIGGLIAWRNLGFGATIAAVLVLILHLGANFFGYSSKEEININ